MQCERRVLEYFKTTRLGEAHEYDAFVYVYINNNKPIVSDRPTHVSRSDFFLFDRIIHGNAMKINEFGRISKYAGNQI